MVRVSLGLLLGIGLWAGAAWLAWGQPVETPPVECLPGARRGRRGDDFRQPLRRLPALWDPAAGAGFPAARPDLRGDGADVAAARAVCRRARPDRRLCRAAAGRRRSAGRSPAFRLSHPGERGSLALLRHRAWWWLAWVSLAGSIGWALLWLGAAYRPEDVWVLGGYLLAQLGLFAALRRGIVGLPFLAGVIDAADGAHRGKIGFLGDVVRCPLLVQPRRQ